MAFRPDGAARSTLLNKANTIMTTQAGSKAHIWKCEIATPEMDAPTKKPDALNYAPFAGFR